MYKSKIFLIGDGKDNLVALEESGYVTESVLQDFLAEYPDLLPGDQIDPEAPRRWLLVVREMGIPGDVNEADRWSLDHLFLDQDGIPTFIECKRATDTRIRREVVAQMLEYAANGVEYWDIDKLRQCAAETAQKCGRSLNDEIAQLLADPEIDEEYIEEYWKTVEANLRQHRIRLVFVADSVPKELRRLVEFLNEEMANVEVLAVEIKQFQKGGHGQKALVPRVLGLTETARAAKASSTTRRGPRLTREEFLQQCPTAAVREFFQSVLSQAEERGHIVYWGEVSFSVRFRFSQIGKPFTFVYGSLPAKFEFYLHKDTFKNQLQTLHQHLLEMGIFKKSGNYTLNAQVTEDNLDRISEAYRFVLDKIDELIQMAQEERNGAG